MSQNEIKLSNLKNFIDTTGLPDDAVIVRKQYTNEGMIIEADEDKTFIATISDISPDMDKDIVYSKGADITRFMKAGPVLWSHAHSSPPVGKVTELTIGETSIKAKIKMADTPFANELWSLIKGGFLKTNSIGFVVKNAILKGTKDFSDFITKSGIRASGNCNRIITDFILVENSLCSIPSNENALIEAISTKSINLDDKLSKELGMDKVEVKEVKEAVAEVVAEVPATEPVKEAVEAVAEPVKEEAKVEAKVEVITEPVKVEQPISEKPPLSILEETYKPSFVILRAGDYIPSEDLIKQYKSGKIIQL